MLARYLAQQLGKSLGQSVVVENRGGANGVIGTTELARSVPDGYTLMLTISSHITNGPLYKDLPYNVLEGLHARIRRRDLAFRAARPIPACPPTMSRT